MRLGPKPCPVRPRRRRRVGKEDPGTRTSGTAGRAPQNAVGTRGAVRTHRARGTKRTAAPSNTTRNAGQTNGRTDDGAEKRERRPRGLPDAAPTSAEPAGSRPRPSATCTTPGACRAARPLQGRGWRPGTSPGCPGPSRPWSPMCLRGAQNPRDRHSQLRKPLLAGRVQCGRKRRRHRPRARPPCVGRGNASRYLYPDPMAAVRSSSGSTSTGTRPRSASRGPRLARPPAAGAGQRAARPGPGAAQGGSGRSGPREHLCGRQRPLWRAEPCGGHLRALLLPLPASTPRV